MKNYKFISIILLTAIVILTSCKDENNPVQTPTTGTIQGKVTNSTGDTVIVGATVWTNPPTSSVTTNSSGDYSIPDVSPGQYSVTALKGAYNSSTVTITVTAGKTTTANIPLNLSTISMGLIAYYPFNSNANDESGNGLNGTVVGATLTIDRFSNPNRAYSFNGQSDQIQVGHSAALNITGDITLSAWFKSIEAPQFMTSHTILTKRSPSIFGSLPYLICINYQYGIPNDYKKPMFVSAVNSTYQYLQSTSDITVNTWNHMVAVVNGNNLRIFINGVVVMNTPINNQLRTGNTAPLLIGSGGRSDYPAEQFKGQIDDVRIYNRALTDNEIQSLYHEGGWQ